MPNMSNPKLHIKGKYWSADDGFRYCESIARSHYENFPVASHFVPKEIRKYVWTIYAFARIADDYADEPGFTIAERMDNLNQWDQYLDECYDGNPAHRVFAALAETVERFQIPRELLQNLLTAFRSDVTVKRYETYEEVLAYCRNSANPIGRLLLLLFNYRSESLLHLSDSICTALQLTNFWQDVSLDLLKDRIYLPLEEMEEFGYTEQELIGRIVNDHFRDFMAFQVRRTADLFVEGKPLLSMVGKDLSLELKLTWNGGTRILQKIHQQNYDVLSKRPSLSKLDKLGLLFRSFLS
ncbi:MAG: squalene synthase HpnC [Ignavibacteriae bacterium]|nr:MAG: squalene synthase HpnC [Ignavibacteriota bacterium]